MGRSATGSGSVARALARISDVEPDLRAFTYVSDDFPAPRARPVGDLDALSVAVKDVIDVEGMPTTAASRVLDRDPVSEDAPMVARLRSAGAVILGKTNLDEFAYGVMSPPTRNPWDRSRIAGGSSGGSAAAIAAGLAEAALGTDTAGSIRIPSALCGVMGLKPRRSEMTGIIPLAPSLDVCGPMARSPETLAAMWRVLSGPRSRTEQYTFRVAAFNVAELELEDEASERYTSLLSALDADPRVDLVRKEPPPVDRWERPAGIVLAREAWEVHSQREWYPHRADLYTPEVRASLDAASRMPSDKVQRARSAMNDARDYFERLMGDVDVVLMPTTPCLAPKAGETGGAARRGWVRRLTRFTAALNFCPGVAAVTIPLWGLGSRLPWGVDAVAADEWTALDFAASCKPAPRVAER